MSERTILETITLENFDPGGCCNPTIRLFSDGEVEIEFYEFPPDHLEHLLDDFDKRLEKEIGEVSVYWEDRELFHVTSEVREPIDVYEWTVNALYKMRGPSA